MGMTSTPLPYYIGYLQPSSTFGLDYAISAIAMPIIGGTTSWAGPVIGAVLLGTLQQLAAVTISSVANLLIVGLLLTGFVVVAPNSILGLMQSFRLRQIALRRHPLLKGTAMKPLLEIDGFGKRFGGFAALEGSISRLRPMNGLA